MRTVQLALKRLPLFDAVGDEFPWGDVRDITKYHSSQLINNPKALEFYCEFLVDCLAIHTCRDEILTTGVIAMYSNLLMHTFLRIFTSNERRAKEIGVILNQINSRNKSRCSSYFNRRYTDCALYSAHLIFLKVIVKYGNCCSPQPHWDSVEAQIAEIIVEDLLHHINQTIGDIVDIEEIFAFAENFGCRCSGMRRDRQRCRRSDRNFTRTTLILRGIDAIIRPMISNSISKEYVRCLTLYFEAVPDALISTSEIENFLMNMRTVCPISEEHVKTLCGSYLDMFPDTPASTQPRTLQHLSKCAIRAQLKKCGTIPALVPMLPLPEKIKNYLMLKDYL